MNKIENQNDVFGICRATAALKCRVTNKIPFDPNDSEDVEELSKNEKGSIANIAITSFLDLDGSVDSYLSIECEGTAFTLSSDLMKKVIVEAEDYLDEAKKLKCDVKEEFSSSKIKFFN